MMLYRYIPWNSDLVCILLNLVITEGAHIAGKKKCEWSAVNDAFFNQNEARLFKDELYKKGDFRKIRDKFKQTMASTKADIDTANQSGRSGDLGPQFHHHHHHLNTHQLAMRYHSLNNLKIVLSQILFKEVIRNIQLKVVTSLTSIQSNMQIT